MLTRQQDKNHIMDTDELSTENYKGIIIEAEKFNHDLTLQFRCDGIFL